MLAASTRKSSSSTIVSANSSTSAGGLASAATGMRPTRCGASHAIARRSVCTSRPTSGRCTLTTTSSPVCSCAACTWAIDAAAIGRVSNDVNTASSGRPSSDSTVRRTTSNGSAGTWSRQRLNSSTSSGGNRPSPEEMTWPSLMNVGPSASAASRRRCDSSAMPADPSARPRLRRTSHGTTARARRDVTTTPRRPGGSRRGVISVGTSCWASRRSCSASAHHVMASRSSTHGASSANAPHCRSSGAVIGSILASANDVSADIAGVRTHVVPSAW